MRRTASSVWMLLLIVGTLAFSGCILTPAGIQFLDLRYRVSQALAAGEESLVHLHVFPEKVTLKKYFVRISGRLSGADTLPERLNVTIESENENGKVYDRARVDWDEVAGKRNAPPGGGYFENKVTLMTENGKLELFMNRSLGLEREIDDSFELG